MKKITLLVCFMVSLAGFAQGTCDTAAPLTAGTPVVVATIDGTELPTPDCSDLGQGTTTAAVWYSYTATVAGIATITSDLPENAGGDTRVYAYTGTCGTLACYGFADDVDYPANNLSTLIIGVQAGTTYYIAWDDQWSTAGFTFQITEEALDCTTSIPFSTSFDDSNSFAACYQKIDNDGNGISFIQQALDLDGDGTDETFATNGSNADADKDDWLITPTFALTAGTSYDITYTYNGADGANPANETLELVILDAPSITAPFQQAMGEDSGIIQDGAFEELFVNAATQNRSFTPTTSGNYNLGFHVTSPAGSGFLLLFGYTVTPNLATPGFQSGKISMYPNPVVNELNVANENVIDSVEVYNLMGQKVLGQTFSSNEVKVNMSQLSSGAYMVKVFSGNSINTMKVIKK